MIDAVIIIITLIGLFVASIIDIKTREVPDWLNFSLIAAGLGIRLIYSLVFWDFSILLAGVIGFALFLGLALLMFYTGQWGGGDSKLLMGLGALIGMDIDFSKIPFLFSMIFNLLIIGAIYGLISSIWLAFLRRKDFGPEFMRLSRATTTAKIALFIIAMLIIVISFFIQDNFLRLISIILGVVLLVMYYTWLFVKAVENCCMIKMVKPTQLTEGDWIVDDIYYRKKRITGPKDLGIDKKQIEVLVDLYKKKKINLVKIKEGIPFVPSFFLAYVFTLIWGNLIFLFL